jgi:hypothetical protein
MREALTPLGGSGTEQHGDAVVRVFGEMKVPKF